MVQSNELMLAKTLETKKELAEKKAREKQEKWQLLKDEGLRKAAIEERRALAEENKARQASSRGEQDHDDEPQ